MNRTDSTITTLQLRPIERGLRKSTLSAPDVLTSASFGCRQLKSIADSLSLVDEASRAIIRGDAQYFSSLSKRTPTFSSIFSGQSTSSTACVDMTWVTSGEANCSGPAAGYSSRFLFETDFASCLSFPHFSTIDTVPDKFGLVAFPEQTLAIHVK